MCFPRSAGYEDGGHTSFYCAGAFDPDPGKTEKKIGGGQAAALLRRRAGSEPVN